MTCGRQRTAVCFRSLLLILALVAAGCSSSRPPKKQVGIASWYGPGFHGKPTASGEVFDMNGISAAHKTLPLGTVVDVENLENGRTLQVRINDRGPFVRGRILDLSRAAAAELGMEAAGIARIRLRVVELPSPASAAYVVQVGAFQARQRAELLAAELRPKYPDVAVLSEGGWHRVRLGGQQTHKRALSLRRSLAREGYEAVLLSAPNQPRSKT